MNKYHKNFIYKSSCGNTHVFYYDRQIENHKLVSGYTYSVKQKFGIRGFSVLESFQAGEVEGVGMLIDAIRQVEEYEYVKIDIDTARKFLCRLKNADGSEFKETIEKER